MHDTITKKYYTIGEVAAMLNEAPSLIRFWEKEFAALKPDKTEKGTRKYEQKDIELLRLIHHLVKEKGYTLQGAAEYIKHEHKVTETAEIIHKLKNVRTFLNTIKQKLDE
jgi:DNA-binding transcriptional MerR regulator